MENNIGFIEETTVADYEAARRLLTSGSRVIHWTDAHRNLFERDDSSRQAVVRHRKQPDRWGCLYYSYAALTGDTHFLHDPEVLAQCSVGRFWSRLAARGYYCFTLFARLENTPTDRQFWFDLMIKYQYANGWLPLLLEIDSARRTDGRHCVAMAVDWAYEGEPIWIADSSAETMFAFNLEEYLATPYANAYAVEKLQPSILDLLDPEDARLLDDDPDFISREKAYAFVPDHARRPALRDTAF